MSIETMASSLRILLMLFSVSLTVLLIQSTRYASLPSFTETPDSKASVDFNPDKGAGNSEVFSPAMTPGSLDSLRQEIAELESRLGTEATLPVDTFETMYMELSTQMEREFYDENILFGMAQKRLYYDHGPIAEKRSALLVSKDSGSALLDLNLDPDLVEQILQELAEAHYQRTLHFSELRAGALPTREELPGPLAEIISSHLTPRQYAEFQQKIDQLNYQKSIYDVEIDLLKINPALDSSSRRRIADVITDVGLLEGVIGEVSDAEKQARIQAAENILSSEMTAGEMWAFEKLMGL